MIELDINIGDTILTGKFRNKPIVVKEIGEDEYGHPTINGKKILSIRIKKLMDKTNESINEGLIIHVPSKYSKLANGLFKTSFKSVGKQYGDEKDLWVFNKNKDGKDFVDHLIKLRIPKDVIEISTNTRNEMKDNTMLGAVKQIIFEAVNLKQFEKLLKSHDWYYAMSDDQRKYNKGEEELKVLDSMRKQLIAKGMKKDVNALWKRYSKSI